jgi:hypothetical protein
MHRYCSYFDHRYLARGLAMVRSLRDMDPGCEITVLCLTPECHALLSERRELSLVLLKLDDFERANPDVVAVKSTRSMLEYYFTLTGPLVWAVLAGSSAGDIVTYVDSDLFFYSPVRPLYNAMSTASVGLVSHRYHWWKKGNARKFGYFNVSWTSFRRDSVGLQAAKWWRERCIEWCHDYADGERYADQKYLDHMYRKFPNVVEIRHAGANVGPWNIGRHNLSRRPGGNLVVDNEWPLVFFHFQGLREIAPGLYLANHLPYFAPLPRIVRDGLYLPYLRLVRQIEEEVGATLLSGTLRRGEVRRTLKQRLFEARVALFRLAGRAMGHALRPASARTVAAGPASPPNSKAKGL